MDIDEVWQDMNKNNPIKSISFDGKNTKIGNSKAVQKCVTNKKTKIVEKSVVLAAPKAISYADVKANISRDINSIGDENSIIRKKALQRLYNSLFVEHVIGEEEYDDLFNDICKSILKRFIDPVEKCRELAHSLCLQFFNRGQNFVPILGYYFPALMHQIPIGIGYDSDMKIFISDMNAHEAYKRGKAVDRQDRGGTSGILTHQVVELSEEIRYISCKALVCLINRVTSLRCSPILHPYFQEIVLFLQTQLKDPYPDLKVIACEALETLAKVPDFETGMKFFSVGLVRALLPVLRHRHAKVRLAAVSALHFCMVVPDRAKRKAAGSEAICDLVGFREENVLQVAAFYKSDVQINYLAEMVLDKSILVREKLVSFLSVLLTEIGDRYDHQTRIIPYLLDLLTDEAPSVAELALRCLLTCGRQYEEEHPDEVIERRQYGIDGDSRINLDKPLPPPFKERPRIGVRLYMRGNSKRFLHALVGELTNWVSNTRLKSAHLLKMVVVLCEEHLTMEANTLFPAFIKALRFAREDKDEELKKVLLEVLELFGRYVVPEVSVFYILPRLRGDVEVVQFGVDSETRIAVMEMLRALLEGAQPQLVTPHFAELVATLTDPFIISPDSPSLQVAAMQSLCTVFAAVRGRSNAVVEAHFVTTGRITSLQTSLRTVLRFLLINLSRPELNAQACRCLEILSQLQSDPHPGWSGVEHLFEQHAVCLVDSLFNDMCENNEGLWQQSVEELSLLTRLVEAPGNPLQHHSASLQRLLGLLCSGSREGDSEEHLLLAMELLQGALLPVLHSLTPLRCGAVLQPLLRSFTASQLSQARHLVILLAGKETVYSQRGVVLSEASATSVVEVLLLSMSRMVDSFMLAGLWSRSAALQTARLGLARLLSGLCCPLSHTHSCSCSSCGSSASSFSGQGLGPPHLFVEPVLGEFVKQHAVQVLTAVASAAAPSNPLALRRSFVCFATQILHSVVVSAYLLVDVRNPEGEREVTKKVKSFRRSRLDAISKLGVNSFGEVDNDEVEKFDANIHQKRVQIASTLRTLLSMLSDSSDQVRIAVLDAVCAAGLLLGWGGGETVTTSTVVEYEDVLTGLIGELRSEMMIEDSSTQIPVVIDSDDCSDDKDVIISDVAQRLDCSLRWLCVLDPARCDTVIRREMALFVQQGGSIGIVQTKQAIGYKRVLNELISHADLLGELDK